MVHACVCGIDVHAVCAFVMLKYIDTHAHPLCPRASPQAGSIVFLILQYTELGGLPTAHRYWSNPENRCELRMGLSFLLSQ